MTAPEPPPAIRVDADRWQLDARPDRLEQAAQAWRTIGKRCTAYGDDLVDGSRTLLHSVWAGPARDTFAAHQSSLVGTLDDAQAECVKVAATLERWAGLLRLYQGALDEEYATITAAVRSDTVRVPLLGGFVTFHPATPEQANLVHAATDQARRTRIELEAALAEELSGFDRGRWAELATAWRAVAEGTVPAFDLPAEATGTGVLMVDGTAVVNTGPGDDVVKVSVDPDTGRVKVTVNGVERSFPPGTPVTVRGGEGKDFIDVPAAAHVNVVLLGGAGDDIIDGGGGGETIIGGGGHDQLYGGAGADYVSGGAGGDYLDGQDGDDLLAGGHGRDVVYGLGGADHLSGGEGDDHLEGATGDDVLHGGAGQDVVSGGRGADTMSGGTGNDALYGGQGRDAISGGGGADTAYRQDGDSVSRVQEDVRVEIAGDHGFIEIQGTPEFQERIRADLEMYRGSPTGQQMLQALADARDPNWGPGENRLTIREFDAMNGRTESEWMTHDSTTVKINPNYHSGDEFGSPAIVLYHELGHVYDLWNDSDSGEDDTHSGGPDDGVENDERRATGLPIDHDDDWAVPTPDIIDPDHPYVYTENALREEMGRPRRDTYTEDGD